MKLTESDIAFLSAIAKGRHRRGAGSRLKKLITRREVGQFGRLHCYCCGLPLSQAEANIEHILPQALGGTWEFENLALSHVTCNAQRGSSNTQRAAPINS